MKQTLCKYFAKGHCKYGTRCKFSHNIGGRSPSRAGGRSGSPHRSASPRVMNASAKPKAKSPRQMRPGCIPEICQKFLQGTCQYGDRCHRQHDANFRPPSPKRAQSASKSPGGTRKNKSKSRSQSRSKSPGGTRRKSGSRSPGGRRKTSSRRKTHKSDRRSSRNRSKNKSRKGSGSRRQGSSRRRRSHARIATFRLSAMPISFYHPDLNAEYVEPPIELSLIHI